MRKNDVGIVAKLASMCFSGLKDIRKARKWVNCNFKAFPRMQYFVAKKSGKILGYILWVEKGGFRKEAVMELEQIAVHPNYRGMGIGTKLIKESLHEIEEFLERRGSSLKIVEVTTRYDNRAKKFYEKVLGAKKEAVLKNFFRGDEIIMIVRFDE